MKPSVSTALTEGISLTWKNFGRFVVPALILFFSIILYTGVSIVASIVTEYSLVVGLVLQMISFILQIAFVFVSAGLFIWVVVRALQVIRSSDNPIFTWSRYGWYLLYQLVIAAVSFIVTIPIVVVSLLGGVGIGALAGTGSLEGAITLAIVAGVIGLVVILALIYLGIRVMLVPYVIADTSANPIEALKRSWRLSHGRFWPLLGLSIFVSMINLIGMFALGIGLIFTIPASHVVLTHYYDQLVLVKKA